MDIKQLKKIKETKDTFVLMLSGCKLIDIANSKRWSKETFEAVYNNLQLINKAENKKEVFKYLIK